MVTYILPDDHSDPQYHLHFTIFIQYDPMSLCLQGSLVEISHNQPLQCRQRL